MKDQWKPSSSSLFIIILLTLPSTSYNQLSSFYNSTMPQSSKTKRSHSFVSNDVDLEKIVKTAGELTFSQSLLREIAATKAREELAEISSNWANVAHSVISSKYSEVIYLTKKSHEAQILSLTSGKTAALLQDAVSKASRVYNSAVERYKILSELSKSAAYKLKSTSEALALLQYILSIREKWATEERTRALRLSSFYLHKVLDELQSTIKFAQDARAAVLDMSSNVQGASIQKSERS